MNNIIEMGKVCKLGHIVFVSYRTSTVLSDWDTFHLNTINGKTANFHTPSVTQWHWNPEMKVNESQLKNYLQNEKDVVDCSKETDMWFKKRMEDVMKLL
ncbi:hypothetical protein AAGG74_18020 [Bacillus mexicanus]|uniref:hypothetical protein n=1 Tax=Bacillus mexicanus TaxID=2834415 RepID=UPI003D2510AC